MHYPISPKGQKKNAIKCKILPPVGSPLWHGTGLLHESIHPTKCQRKNSFTPCHAMPRMGQINAQIASTKYLHHDTQRCSGILAALTHSEKPKARLALMFITKNDQVRMTRTAVSIVRHVNFPKLLWSNAKARKPLRTINGKV